VPTILEMGTYCRLDCALGTSGLIRASLSQAMHHASHRSAFGKLLIDQPLMRNVLADLALESEAATALSLRLARAYDAQKDEAESFLRRVLTPAAKYWICKRGPAMAAEVEPALGRDKRLDRFVSGLKDEMRKRDNIETRARAITQGIAIAVQGALLARAWPAQRNQRLVSLRDQS
jgi:putative acyl-CoA dehydrogenase